MAAQTKKLVRNSTNAQLGGVCSGLGLYFGVDPLIFRLLFVFLFLVGGGGLLLYLLLWLFIPSDGVKKPTSKGAWIFLIIFVLVFVGMLLYFSTPH